MSENIVLERVPTTTHFKQQAFHSQSNLEKRVTAIHQERIKVLQKEMVEISLQNNQDRKIGPILEEIRKLRVLLSFTKKAKLVNIYSD